MTRSKALNLTQFSRTVLSLRHWVLQVGVLGVILGIAPAWCDAQNTASRFEVKNYVVTAELLPSQHLLSAQARVDIVPNSDLTTLAFELHSNLRVEKIVDTAGQEVAFKQDGQALNLSLLNPLPAGKDASVTIKYGGMLNSTDGSPVEDIKVAYVGPEGSYLLYLGHWFPVSTNHGNRFTATMNITVPSDETVVASGRGGGSGQRGRGGFFFLSKHRVGGHRENLFAVAVEADAPFWRFGAVQNRCGHDGAVLSEGEGRVFRVASRF